MRKDLLEITRKEILSKGRREDPAKYARRLSYVNSIKPQPMARDLFIKTGTLTVPMRVGDYVVTVHISGILKLVQDEMDRSGRELPDRQIVYRALRKAVDESNMYVDCTCADFKYRYAYLSTINDYKYGKPETRPAKITNPDNNGSVCKHITAALARPSQWLKYVSGWIATIIKQYILRTKKDEPEEEDVNDEEMIEVTPDEVEILSREDEEDGNSIQ